MSFLPELNAIPSGLWAFWELGAIERFDPAQTEREYAAMGWFSSNIDTFDELFVHTLQDIYYAEHQIVKALPDMVEKASDAELKKGFRSHLRQTHGQIKRLDRVFRMIKSVPQGTKCPAIDGIIEEANEIAGEIENKTVLNAALIAAAQAVEHYEMTRYGTLVAWAKLLGRNDVAKLLSMNLNEEKATDKKLGGIAKRKINRKAANSKLPKPDRSERAEDAILAAAAGIPAI
jgi:ferritin-like metal-binding protein YciE